MRLFLYEYTCAPAHSFHEGQQSLRAEGAAMLSAFLEDSNRVPGVTAFTLLADDCDLGLPPSWCRRERADREQVAFRRLAGEADFTLVIAPECDDILWTRCRWVEEASGRLLGPSPSAVRLTGDKLALGRFLKDRGIPTPECQLWGPGLGEPAISYPAVWKPRWGAGSLATFLVCHPDELLSCVEAARREGGEQEALLQPFVEGLAASVAFLTGPHEPVALLPAAQHLSDDGRFHYLGGSLPLPTDLGRRAVYRARQAIQAVSGLCGYVGVDVVLGPAADGRQDWVIEINPRLTTSYVGLRILARTNLAEAMLGIATGQPAPILSWHPGGVHFQADGRVTWDPPANAQG